MSSSVMIPLYGYDVPGPMNCVLGVDGAEEFNRGSGEGDPPTYSRQIRLKQRAGNPSGQFEPNPPVKITERNIAIVSPAPSAPESAWLCLSSKRMMGTASTSATSVILNVIEGRNIPNQHLINGTESGVFVEAQSWVQDWLQVPHGDLVECETLPGMCTSHYIYMNT
jgi:hypothetical protein